MAQMDQTVYIDKSQVVQFYRLAILSSFSFVCLGSSPHRRATVGAERCRTETGKRGTRETPSREENSRYVVRGRKAAITHTGEEENSAIKSCSVMQKSVYFIYGKKIKR